ncbi:ATP-binding protein [Streptomyces sp. NPDC091266]|uniref:ATP-binding protein n=1 Tax=Streptomyces sp. NPDC091266 TaxID=3365978 RepID=UPI0038167E70
MTAPPAPPPLAHPGTERPPLRPTLLTTLATGLLGGVAVTVSAALAPPSARAAIGWCAGAAVLLLCAAVAVATHTAWTARQQARQLETAGREAGLLLHDRDRLAGELTAERHRSAVELSAEQARHAEELTAERAKLDDEHARLVEEARTATADRAAALAACANAAGRMQAVSTGILADLREMEERHADESVLGDLLHLDHRTAQAGRLADSIAVLTGARSGRRWARPIAMESILRGAMGRIGGYQRIRVHSTSDAAIAGHAAEGVMHALAELLDNAANFSPPTAEVHTYVEEVPAGVIVSVEDSGLVMGEEQLRRAERAVSGEAKGLVGLSGSRLGLAVVGRLARKHGLTVSYRPSARGGTGVLVLIPQDLLSRSAATPSAAPADRGSTVARGPSAKATAPRREPAPAPEPVATPRPAPAPEPAPGAGAAAPDGAGPGGLPRRKRGQTLAAAEGTRRDAPRPPTPASAPDDVKARVARFGTFRQAVRTPPTEAGPATGEDLPTREEPGRPDPTDAPDAPDASDAPTPTTTGRAPAAPPHPEGDTPR